MLILMRDECTNTFDVNIHPWNLNCKYSCAAMTCTGSKNFSRMNSYKFIGGILEQSEQA